MSKRPALKDKLLGHFKLMMSINAPPHKMALSCALGMLVGISPYVGLQTYIAIACSSLFKVPIYPVIIGVNLTNPITIPFVFTLTTKFGMWLLNMDITVKIDWSDMNLKTLLSTGKSFFLPFMVGTHVAGIILSVFTYLLVYYIMKMYKY
ncbi:MAG: DUF2062 domain-containing protein [Deferribacteraceae bacterium]|jgi:uncharacterized protein (DUF2062 family)|nr:DUF2062 domain-containing protein [Deferribacteraceae bacterium]